MKSPEQLKGTIRYIVKSIYGKNMADIFEIYSGINKHTGQIDILLV